MKIQMIKTSALLGMLMFMFSGLTSAADEPAQTKMAMAATNSASPYEVVDGVISNLMVVVRGGKEALKTNPQGYFDEVRVIMSEAVDFKHIARNVMGPRYWKEASPDQKSKFIDVFASGMVQTFAKGMANFADYDISVQEPKNSLGDRRRVEVIQKFSGPDGVNRVSYTMGKHRSGEWKLINVVLDGVNLGKTLRSQFSQAVRESEGNLDMAIEGWAWES